LFGADAAILETQKVPGPVNVCILQVGVLVIVPPVATINGVVTATD
jgi:hypothetical protein